MMKILDGKQLSETIKEEIAREVEKIKKKDGHVPHLATILVGNDAASQTYVANKIKACEKVGFDSTMYRFKDDIKEKELLFAIDRLNDDDKIDGILVQLPLPEQIDVEKVTQRILPEKDVDGFHPVNIGRMALNQPAYISATPYGILQLLERNNIETEGKHCVILGRSDIVGRPMSILMSRKANPGSSNGYPDCTVTICHSRTKDIKAHSLQADILIVAMGKTEFVTADMVKDGAVVIDVGISRVKDSSKKSGYGLKGDVKFDEVAPKCSYITPVPGGVGPMTIAALLQNTLKSAKKEIYLGV